METQIENYTEETEANQANSNGEDTVASFDLLRVQNLLKTYYKSKRSTFGFVPGRSKSNEQFFIDDFFVEPSIVRKETNGTKVTLHELTNYHDLVNSEDVTGTDKLPQICILLGADVGLGKTTIINKLALDWARELPSDDKNHNVNGSNAKQNPLSRFDLVLVLDAKTLQARMDLADAMKDQLLPDVPKSAIITLLTGREDKILCLIDGYDQLRSRKKVLNKILSDKVHVIVTTRLDKVDEFCTRFNGFAQITILGVAWKSRKIFANNYLNLPEWHGKMNPDTINFVQNLKLPYLNQVSYHPLILTTMCVIFKTKKEVPIRMTTVYDQAINDLAMHLYEKSPPRDTSTAATDSMQLNELVLVLGQHALDGLVGDDLKLVFDKREIDTIGRFRFESVNIWLVLSSSAVCACIGLEVGLRFESLYLALLLAVFGLLLGSILLCVKINHIFNITERGENLGLLKRTSSSKKRTSNRIQYLFLHRTFQDFCAAKYWTSLAATNTCKFEDYLTRITKGNVMTVQNLLRFCCGLNGEAATMILQHIVNYCEIDQLDERFKHVLLLEAETGSGYLQDI